MTDDPYANIRELEQRVAWLERELVGVLFALIAALGLLGGAFVYWMTVESFGGLIAFGCAVVAWVAIGLYLRRHHFRGAPKHIRDFT
jgi:hypothetical protein